MKEILIFAPFATFARLNLPSTSVDAPFWVPTTKTEAPAKGSSSSSVTKPVHLELLCGAVATDS